MRISVFSLTLTLVVISFLAEARCDDVQTGEAAFTRRPTVTKADDCFQIEFAVAKETDVEVAIVDGKGSVVRHIAAGMLGENPPAPLTKDTLAQSIVWDGKDDHRQGVTGKFKVRVRLGIRPCFDAFLLYDKDAMPPVTHVAPGPQGNLYVFYRDPTANGNQGGHKLRIIDRQGRFVRQLIPFPADLPHEKVKPSGVFIDHEGRLVPRTHSWHRLDFYPSTNPVRGRDFSEFQCPIVDEQGRIYWIMDGGHLCAVNKDGSLPYDDYLGPELFPGFSLAKGRISLAFSSDGKAIYAAGISNGRWQQDTVTVPCVYRIELATRKAEVFLGNKDKQGKGGELFSAPRGVATHDELLYVADPAADRVAVFREDDHALVGEMKIEQPHIVQVHPETGAVYVCAYVPEEKPRDDGKPRPRDANLLKFNSYKDKQPVYQIALPRTGLSPNYGTHRIVLDTFGNETRLWVPAIPYSRQGSHLSYVRDTGEKFELVDMPPPDRPWGNGPRDLLVDRRRGRLYVKVQGESWHEFDDATGQRLRLIHFPFEHGGPRSGAHGTNLGIDSEGNFITHCWGRQRGLMRWSPDLEPLPWQGQKTHRTEWGGMMTFQLNYMTLHNDQIYLIKPGAAHHLDVLDMGLNRKRRAIWNVRRGCTPRVDAAGNIYITVPLRPLDRDFPAFFDGKLKQVPDYFRDLGSGNYWYTYMYGSIVKFPPSGGGFEWVESQRIKHDWDGYPEELAKMPKEQFHYFQGGRYPHKVCNLQGARWVRFGYSPYSETYPAGTPVCMCEGTGFDVDGFGRVFYPNLPQFRVEMIDTNNNYLGHFGHYGNQDSGPEGRIQEPGIPLAWPTYVVVGKDHAYVNDTVGMRVVRVKLDYAATAECDLEL